MGMMPRDDEELKGLSRRNKGGISREGEARDEKFVLQYLRSIL